MKRPVLFDIGNVLIRYEPGAAVARLAELSDHAPWRVRLAFATSGGQGLGVGKTGPEDFVKRLGGALGVSLSHAELREIWGLDLRRPVEGMLELLEETLASGAAVGLLSDTNLLHWEYLAAQWPLLARVPYRFLSFEAQMRKPSLEFFRYAESRLREAENGRAAGPPVYFDDLEPNVRGALDAGWDAHLFSGAASARAILVQRGILTGLQEFPYA